MYRFLISTSLLALLSIVDARLTSSTLSSLQRQEQPNEIVVVAEQRQQRALPPKVMVGYATECNDKVVTAVKDGVNIVVWAFYHLSPGYDAAATAASTTVKERNVANKVNVDLKCIQSLIHDLDEQGYDDTIHLVSVGGWNGPHLDPYFTSAQEWYDAWKALVGHVFHGLDVSLAGNDDLPSAYNAFSISEMDQVGEIFQLAKQDGYITTMAPLQSYLDIQSSKFSRYLNLTDPDRGSWGNPTYSSFGENAYAYWLAKYGDFIDLVMIQFFESWSRASMEIFGEDMLTPENYLTQYVWDLNGGKQQTFYVDFGSDPDLGLDSQDVAFPITKLVWGFANGWAVNSSQTDHEHVYIAPECIQAGYQNLWDWMLDPRGLMFYDISQEGEGGIFFAQGLNEIVHTRTRGGTTTTEEDSIIRPSSRIQKNWVGMTIDESGETTM